MVAASPNVSPTDEVLDFLLSAPTPEAILALQLSPTAQQQRLSYLLDGNRNETLKIASAPNWTRISNWNILCGV